MIKNVEIYNSFFKFNKKVLSIFWCSYLVHSLLCSKMQGILYFFCSNQILLCKLYYASIFFSALSRYHLQKRVGMCEMYRYT